MRPVAFMLLLLCAIPFWAQRQSSIRKGLKADKGALVATRDSGLLDTVAASGTEVRFSGYEKTLRSTRETVFLTNLSGRELDRVIFHITYFDAQGRQLHKVRKNLYAGIPPGETRRLDFPTWDRQFAFYYIRSPRPRVSAIPYNVSISPDTLIFAR